MIIQLIKFKTGLGEAELLRRAREREPLFKELPGLLQKYYLKTGKQGEYGGLYVWDSAESLKTYRESELAASIPKAYDVKDLPNFELLDVLFTLRD